MKLMYFIEESKKKKYGRIFKILNSRFLSFCLDRIVKFAFFFIGGLKTNINSRYQPRGEKKSCIATL